MAAFISLPVFTAVFSFSGVNENCLHLFQIFDLHLNVLKWSFWLLFDFLSGKKKTQQLILRMEQDKEWFFFFPLVSLSTPKIYPFDIWKQMGFSVLWVKQEWLEFTNAISLSSSDIL